MIYKPLGNSSILSGGVMVREFTRNLFVMLVAIMIGVIVITFFIADIQRQTQIETITIEHQTEIQDIARRTENFTNHFLQGTVKMDAAREIREVGNYHFDFALFWYNTALINTTNTTIQRCIHNCTIAMDRYLASHQGFNDSKPYFINAQTYTDEEKYIEVLGYYVLFAQSGRNITLLRYNASKYLKYAAENLSLGQLDNVAMLMENFTAIEDAYAAAVQDYNDYKGQIDEYLFFDEIREPH